MSDKEFLVYIVNGEMKIASPDTDDKGGHVGRLYAVIIDEMTGKPEFRPIGVQ